MEQETNIPIPQQSDSTNTPQTPGIKKEESFISEIIRFSVIALIIVLPIRIFIAQPFIVSGSSMEPTFSTGQYIIVDQLTYQLNKPERGDVIIFRYPKDPSKFFIKRVIAIPGDTINIAGRTVIITNADHPNGLALTEPYILTMAPTNNMTEKLGSEEYFVMGDNRDASSDSRTWGVLQENNIIGRAYLRLFPFTDINLLPGAYDTSTEFISTISK